MLENGVFRLAAIPVRLRVFSLWEPPLFRFFWATTMMPTITAVSKMGPPKISMKILNVVITFSLHFQTLSRSAFPL